VWFSTLIITLATGVAAALGSLAVLLPSGAALHNYPRPSLA
jgi:hypothetical protein